MNNFQSFVFQMRFDKQAISKVSHDEQIERIFRYLHALGELRPLLGRWFLQADSLSEALSLNVMNAPHLLEQAVTKNFDADFPAWLSLSVWNGEQNPLKGGLHSSTTLMIWSRWRAWASKMPVPWLWHWMILNRYCWP